MSLNKRLINAGGGGGGAAAFNTVLYTGNGGTQNITGLGFQPDFVYIKTRNIAGYSRESSIVMASDELSTFGDISPICATSGTPVGLLSYDSDGFTVQTGNGALNNSGTDYVAWCWKFSNSVSINLLGSLSSTISTNPDYGQSVVKYTGNQTAGATFGHGLNQAPELIIGKTYGQCSPSYIFQGAYVWSNVVSGKNEGYLSGNNAWENTLSVTSVDSNVVTLSNYLQFNRSVDNLAYCFHSVEGYSKVGSYTGNGSTTGPIVTTGFEPAFVMIRRTQSTSGWAILDNKRSTSNPRTAGLFANLTQAELVNSLLSTDFNSDGFQLKTNWDDMNQSGEAYFYVAFAV